MILLLTYNMYCSYNIKPICVIKSQGALKESLKSVLLTGQGSHLIVMICAQNGRALTNNCLLHTVRMVMPCFCRKEFAIIPAVIFSGYAKW